MILAGAFALGYVVMTIAVYMLDIKTEDALSIIVLHAILNAAGIWAAYMQVTSTEGRRGDGP